MKTPAFQFYPQDFMIGTMYLSAEARGVYISLLCHLWVDTDDCESEFEEKKLAKVCGIPPKKFQKIFSEIEEKFKFFEKKLEKNENFLKKFFFNERLKKIKNEQNEYLKSRSEAGKKGMETRWNKPKDENKEQENILLHSYSSVNNNAITSGITKNNPSPSSLVNKEIKREFLEKLKNRKKISDFLDTKNYQEDYAGHFLELKEKIGEQELNRRIDAVMATPFHQPKCNKIKYLYTQVSAFVSDTAGMEIAQKAEKKQELKKENEQREREKLEAEEKELEKKKVVDEWISLHTEEFKKMVEENILNMKYPGSSQVQLAMAKNQARVLISQRLSL